MQAAHPGVRGAVLLQQSTAALARQLWLLHACTHFTCTAAEQALTNLLGVFPRPSKELHEGATVLTTCASSCWGCQMQRLPPLHLMMICCLLFAESPCSVCVY